jgi:hypothetical protein
VSNCPNCGAGVEQGAPQCLYCRTDFAPSHDYSRDYSRAPNGLLALMLKDVYHDVRRDLFPISPGMILRMPESR